MPASKLQEEITVTHVLVTTEPESVKDPVDVSANDVEQMIEPVNTAQIIKAFFVFILKLLRNKNARTVYDRVFYLQYMSSEQSVKIVKEK